MVECGAAGGRGRERGVELTGGALVGGEVAGKKTAIVLRGGRASK